MKLSRIAMVAAILGLLAGAGVASATNPVYELNIYGASAQFTFWQYASPSFLTSSFSCGSYDQAFDSSGKHGITWGHNCTIDQTPADIIIRYTSKASYDGIFAAAGIDNTMGDLTCYTQHGGTLFQRQMADETGVSGSGHNGTVSALKCVDVTLGASDVAAVSFTQSSHGAKLGPLGGGWQDHPFPPTGITTGPMTTYRPIVVPFGFFVNKVVTEKTCSNGDTPGAQCTADTDCPNGTAGSCVSATITNISRAQAVQIFSGQAYNWSDFGKGYTTLPIIACLRHAGSGTHATLDNAVMHQEWGNALVSTENTDTGAGTVAYFNDGTPDLMNCVDAKGFDPGSLGDGQGHWAAIGYSDADQLTGSGATTYANTRAVTYNGVIPSRINIRNGVYDNFFTNEWLYHTSQTVSDKQQEIIDKLVAYASDPVNLTNCTSLGAKRYYWATQYEMNWNKGTDQAYPSYAGATIPQSP